MNLPRLILASASRGSDPMPDRKSTRLNSSHDQISYAVFCLKKKKKINDDACHDHVRNSIGKRELVASRAGSRIHRRARTATAAKHLRHVPGTRITCLRDQNV